MTLIVGVLCEDGCVIGADRQATHGAMGQQTVGQPTTKVKIIEGNTLIATSGKVGMGQQFSALVERKHKEIGGRNYHSFDKAFQKDLRDIINPALETAHRAIPVVGHQAAMSDAVCCGLLATKFKDGLRVIEISPQGGLEALTNDIPFVCLGSGKSNADPFLRYIWSVLFDDGMPTIQQGVLAAYWTVKTAIALKSPGVGFSVDVFTLAPDGDAHTATQYSDAALSEHDDFIAAAESALRQIKDATKGGDVGAAEPPPVLEEGAGDGSGQ